MSTNVKSQMETVEKVFSATLTALSSLQDGERVQLKELAKTVGLSTALEPKVVLPFVSYFVHNTTVAYVTRGKKGGIIKGVKPAKVVKSRKKDSDDSDSSDQS